jgi:transposase
MAARRKKAKRSQRSRQGLQTVMPNAAGIDVGAASHFVAVPIDRDDEPVREFSAFTSGLHALADWLQSCGVETVAMESTGVYWIPLYDLLEERGIEVFLVNARHIKGVPGRKSDVLDCQWLQQLHSYGLLRRSFRPDADFLKLRTYLRHRGTLIDARSSLVQQMQKALTLSNLQLHLVVTDIAGQTGMRIIRDILAGNHDPNSLAEHRHYRCKASADEIAEALRGEFREEHLFLLRQAVELYDAYGAKLAECDHVLEQLLKQVVHQQCADIQRPPLPRPQKKPQRRPKEAQFDIRGPLYQLTGVDLTAVPGLNELSALQLVGEIGIDMARWKTADHFVSWTTLAPSCRITGGKARPSRRPASAHRVAEILRMAAMNAGRTTSALGGFYRRLAVRAGKGKAIVALAAKLARIIYAMLRNHTAFEDGGAAAYEERYRVRVVRNLERRAQDLGFQLVPAA